MGAGTAITTAAANFGIGGTSEGGASGTLEVRGGSLRFAGADTSLNFGSGSLAIADGVSFTLGALANRLDQLRIGYNVSGVDLADAVINLTGDQFAAYVADELSVGRVANVGWQAEPRQPGAGRDSTVDLGTPHRRPRSTSAGTNRPAAPATPAIPQSPVPPPAARCRPRYLTAQLSAQRRPDRRAAPPTAP
ncbi:MAG: hypothetical protein IPK39_14755 [Sulfuritalea sp.]|nr:hypothetical protein [Sulfuritalea sp.]